MSNIFDKIKDLALGLGLPILEKSGADKLKQLLQKFHDSDKEKYKATVIAGHAFIKPLIEFCSTTETKIDDDLVAALNHVIEESAKDNDIKL